MHVRRRKREPVYEAGRATRKERDREKKVGCRRSTANGEKGRKERDEREKERERGRREGEEEGRRKAEKMGDLNLGEEKRGERVQWDRSTIVNTACTGIRLTRRIIEPSRRTS